MRKTMALVLSLIMCAICLMPCFAFADTLVKEGEIVSPDYNEEIKGLGISNKDLDPENLVGVQKNVSVEDIGAKIEKKGLQVADIIRKVGRILCVIAFVLCLIMAAYSALARGPFLIKSLMGALVAAIAYALITYGNVIMEAFTGFLAG